MYIEMVDISYASELDLVSNSLNYVQ